MHAPWDDIALVGPQAVAARQRTEALLAEATRLRLAQTARSGARSAVGSWATAIAVVLFAPRRPWTVNRSGAPMRSRAAAE